MAKGSNTFPPDDYGPSPTDEDIRAMGLDPKTMLPPGHPVSILANSTEKYTPAPVPSQLSEKVIITASGEIIRKLPEV
jgi:hypothetical protein